MFLLIAKLDHLLEKKKKKRKPDIQKSELAPHIN